MNKRQINKWYKKITTNGILNGVINIRGDGNKTKRFIVNKYRKYEKYNQVYWCGSNINSCILAEEYLYMIMDSKSNDYYSIYLNNYTGMIYILGFIKYKGNFPSILIYKAEGPLYELLIKTKDLLVKEL